MHRFRIGLRFTGCVCSLAALVAWTLLTVQAADDSQPAAPLTPPALKPESAAADKVRGHRVPDFVLADSAGRQVALSDFSDQKFLVLVCMGTECPIGNQYLPELISLQQKLREQSVQFLGINPNPGDTAEEIATHLQEFKIDFPVLLDSEQILAQCLGAKRTPEVFVLDSRRIVRYHGRIDDRLGTTERREQASRKDLEAALTELLAGQSVSVAETEPAGCLITYRKRLKAGEEITYAKHVSRIIQARCQECHHRGTAAPFSLLNYDDAVNWSAMIKEVVSERTMPPWHADPRHGKFRTDFKISQEEIDTLVAWVDQGTPQGNDQDLPPERQYADGWRIGKPDVVFKMPHVYTVPATGTVKYQYFRTPTNFTEDMWIQAAEAHPGNRAVVHHVIVLYRDPKEEKGKNRQHPERGWIAAAAPGSSPALFPAGVGKRIPAGAELIWQVHYTPTGKEEQDQSELGLIFCKEPPRHNLVTQSVANRFFVLLPGASHHRVTSEMVIPRDVMLLSFMPHMHLRGKDFEYQAVFPDGKSEVLLSVPNYDFNWQHTYRLEEPRKLPKGTKIKCTAHFDNSTGNPANPNPKEWVRWGDQTWEEMMIGYINYIEDGEPETISAKGK